MVGTAGVEPATFDFEDHYSSPLSYVPMRKNNSYNCQIILILAGAIGIEPIRKVLETSMLAVKHQTPIFKILYLQ